MTNDEVREHLRRNASGSAMLPFILKSRQLFTFGDLSDARSPFRDAVERKTVERHPSEEWWDNEDLARWYVQLLNRALNKLTGRLDLHLDQDHDRYYFQPDGDVERIIRYRSLTGRRQRRNVAWQPILRHSGEPRKYWEHLAVGLRFHRVGSRAWVLSIRPERRFTRDGFAAITPKGTGRRSTSRKSRMYNEQVLSEVNFWRDYLSRGRPRIVFDFGAQALMVSSTLLALNIEWPGVPADARPFTHQEYDEDLFTLSELQGIEDREDSWE